VVAVTVKVPHHRELVSAALAAGKAVYCEWPLGRDLDDARAMAALAAEQGVRTVVGLQARQAPAIEFVQKAAERRYVGEVLSTTHGRAGRAQALSWASPTPTCSTRQTGPMWLTIAVGHSLDILKSAWVTQQARNLSIDGRLDKVERLIRDRDAKFSAPFDEVFRTEGVQVIRTPIRAPNANAFAERWVATAPSECLDWVLIRGRRHLRRAPHLCPALQRGAATSRCRPPATNPRLAEERFQGLGGAKA
jgi:GFO/IDH/MocA oxidoreductase family protein